MNATNALSTVSAMPLREQIIIIAICSIGTLITRFLPFIIFKGSKPVPEFVHYLGKALPPAIFALLAVYCLRGINIFQGNRGIPEFIGVSATTILYIVSKKNMMAAIAGGTAVYMILVQFIFTA